MRISFIYKVDKEWNDGLKKAIDVLGEKYEIKHQNGTYTNYLADLVLVWGSLDSWQSRVAVELPFKKAICLAGGLITEDIHKYDIVFVETAWQQNELKKIGVSAHLAFGTNTDIFYNMNLPERPIDYLFPAAFALWKRHSLFVKKPGLKVAVGEMQPNGWERECYDICTQNGVIVIPKISYEATAWLYNQSKNVYLPSELYGGCERAILEGLTCGCQVEVESDNPKLTSLLEYTKKNGVPSYVDYANALRRGIEE